LLQFLKPKFEKLKVDSEIWFQLDAETAQLHLPQKVKR